MEKEILDKWRRIYFFLDDICSMNPWKAFDEKDISVLFPKGTQEEHFFTFFGHSSDDTGIAIYPSSDAYFGARERRRKNFKQEPVGVLQDATVFRFGDRKAVSKTNYEVIKALNIPCRGHGSWPFFQRYRVGYAPVDVPVEALDTLLDDMGNLMMMVRAVLEGHMDDQLGKGDVLVRYYSPEDDAYYTRFTKTKGLPKPIYGTVTMKESPRLNKLRNAASSGTMELDWSFLPLLMKEGKEKVVPRLVLIMDAKTGKVLKNGIIPLSEEPHQFLAAVLENVIDEFGKPSAVEICDEEVEGCIADFCRKTGIRVVKKKRLKWIPQERQNIIKTFPGYDSEIG